MAVGNTFEKLVDDSPNNTFIEVETSALQVIEKIFTSNVIHDHVTLLTRIKYFLESDDVWVIAQSHDIEFVHVLSFLSVIET